MYSYIRYIYSCFFLSLFLLPMYPLIPLVVASNTITLFWLYTLIIITSVKTASSYLAQCKTHKRPAWTPCSSSRTTKDSWSRCASKTTTKRSSSSLKRSLSTRRTETTTRTSSATTWWGLRLLLPPSTPQTCHYSPTQTDGHKDFRPSLAACCPESSDLEISEALH